MSEEFEIQDMSGNKYVISVKPPVCRKPTEEELRNFGLVYYGGELMEPLWVTTGNIWYAAMGYKLSWYAFYNTGTNSVTVLKYSWDKDAWEIIPLEKVDCLVSLFWVTILNFIDNPQIPEEWK